MAIEKVGGPQSKKHKTVRAFGWASFLHDMGADMISPVWPVFVTEVLGASRTALGFLDGLGDAFVALSQAFSGYLSDRLKKRKIFIWLGYFFGALSRIGYVFAPHWQALIPFRVLDRSGKIRDAPRDAMLADVSEHKRRGGNFGFVRAMDNLGAVCGILLSLLLLQKVGFRVLFLLAAIPSLFAVLLIILRVREQVDGGVYQPMGLKNLNRHFVLFLVLNAFFTIGAFSYSFLLLYAKAFGFTVVALPLLYLLFTAIASGCSFPFGKLVDLAGRKTMLAFAFFLWALVCISLLLFQEMWMIVIAFVLYGLHKGALETAQRTFASELVAVDFRARGLGSLQMVLGLCALPASLLAGALWDTFGLTAPLVFSLISTAVALLLLMLVRERQGV